MNTAEVIERLESEGISLTLTPSGGLDVSGNKEAVGRVLSFLRNHKAEIVDLLARMTPANQKPTLPTSCQGCHALDVLTIAGVPVAGCVQRLSSGPWLEEWRHLDSLAQCPKQKPTIH